MVKIIKKRVKRSLLWKIPHHELSEKVKTSTSLTAILRAYGLENKGGNSHTLKRRLIEDNIDFSHIKLGVDSNKGRKFWEINLMTLDECFKHIFVENSTYNRSTVKRYLRHYNLIAYTCSECQLGDEWNEKPLTLQLDHKNGISNDNRLENLRWICPNCHTQTPTYAGRNPNKPKKPSEIDSDWMHRDRVGRRKVKRPSKEALTKDLMYLSFVAVGKKYGVSDNAVRKWCKRYGV